MKYTLKFTKRELTILLLLHAKGIDYAYEQGIISKKQVPNISSVKVLDKFLLTNHEFREEFFKEMEGEIH